MEWTEQRSVLNIVGEEVGWIRGLDLPIKIMSLIFNPNVKTT